MVVTNGCEVDVTTTSNCVTCGNECPQRDNATATCGGGCGFTCNAPWDNCNVAPEDGCEANLTEGGRCGYCNTDAPVNCDNNATFTCTQNGAAYACGSLSCTVGFGNCNLNVNDGCELATNVNGNCGVCGRFCANNGFCVRDYFPGVGSCTGDSRNFCCYYGILPGSP